MASQCQIAPRPESLGLDSGRVEELLAQAQACVEEAGLPSAQIALARDGALAALCTLDGGGERAGPPAGNDTLYAAFSATKAVTASAAWILLQEGALSLDEPVARAIPEFASHGKGVVTLRHLLAHTAGFPNAPFEPLEWDDPARRLARFAQWRLEWPPGTRFQYHPASSMWVVAALIERRAGVDFRAFVRERVARPLGLARLHLGLPAELDARVAEIVHVGEAPSAERLAAVGLRLPAEIVGDELAMERHNLRAYRAVGTPGGGGVMNAGDLALFYQALLRDGRAPDGSRVWTPEVLAEARRVQTGELRDPMTGRLASRGLGIVIAGDETRVYRAFAPEHSPAAFGHPGAGGQLAWADPECGLSFALLTNGIDRNALRVGGRNLALSNAALACLRC